MLPDRLLPIHRTENTSEAVDNKEQAFRLFLYFDQNHNNFITLRTLACYGIRGHMVQLIHKYFYRSQQRISFKESKYAEHVWVKEASVIKPSAAYMTNEIAMMELCHPKK